MDTSRPISAEEIIKDPGSVDFIYDHYIILRDMSMFARYTNLIKAINLLSERGWDIVSLSADASYMYALCRNPRVKRKNEMLGDKD